MPKVIIKQVPAATAAKQNKEEEGQEDIDWKKYAQLLRKENQEQEKKIQLYQTGKKKPSKRFATGPASLKQEESRGEFKKRVREAQALYAGGTSGRKWKDCMSEVYEKAREVKLQKAKAEQAEKERLENL